MAISKIPSAGFQDNVKFRNIIINGDMSIAQRGTSFSCSNSSGDTYTLDRFEYIDVDTPDSVYTITQDTDVPSGQGFAKSLKVDVATADASLDSSDGTQIETKIEGQNLQYLNFGNSSAKSLTLSFWVKSNKTGTYVVRLLEPDASSRMVSFAYTISSSNTWEKKTISVPADTGGTINNDNGAGLNITWWLSAGTDYQSGSLASTWQSYSNGDSAVGQVNLADSTSNEWYITGVQLEAGTTASDFEFLPHDVNLNRCLRYFQGINGAINMHQTSNASAAIVHFSLQQNMRATPTMAIANQTANIGVFGGNNDAINPSISGAKSTSTYGSCEYTHGQNFHSDSAGESQILIYNDFGTTFFTMDAEL